ncbi:MAG: cytochrome c [Bacteroidales bacterium]|jgi:nitrite reductase (NO-forming)|nr:cytochrome c [Bacteroidales bacterium]
MKKIATCMFLVAILAFTGNSFASTTPGDDPADAKYPKGAAIYKAKCVACHQLTGMGIPSAFPPLKDSDYLFADKKRAVLQVLNGSHHEITVNGAKYNLPMPFQVDTHEDAVAVINYVLNAWGNNGGTVKLEDVKDIKIVR